MNRLATSAGYLDRAEKLLLQPDASSLVYAAFELRCGVEARMQEYASHSNTISKRQSNDWRIRHLARTIDSAFRLGDTMLILSVNLKSGGVARFLYAPVSSRLQKIAERCGDYLHARQVQDEQTQERWDELREMLIEGCGLLSFSCSGELVQPNVDDELHFILEAGDSRIEAVRALQEGTHEGVTLFNFTPTGPPTWVVGDEVQTTPAPEVQWEFIEGDPLFYKGR